MCRVLIHIWYTYVGLYCLTHLYLRTPVHTSSSHCTNVWQSFQDACDSRFNVAITTACYFWPFLQMQADFIRGPFWGVLCDCDLQLVVQVHGAFIERAKHSQKIYKAAAVTYYMQYSS
jgi:hypothetical protein